MVKKILAAMLLASAVAFAPAAAWAHHCGHHGHNGGHHGHHGHNNHD